MITEASKMKQGKIISVPVTDARMVRVGNKVIWQNKIHTTGVDMPMEIARDLKHIGELKTLAVEHIEYNASLHFDTIKTIPLSPDQWQEVIDKGLLDKDVWFEEVNKDMWSKHKGLAEIVARVKFTVNPDEFKKEWDLLNQQPESKTYTEAEVKEMKNTIKQQEEEIKRLRDYIGEIADRDYVKPNE